jgi:hypothetical protein
MLFIILLSIKRQTLRSVTRNLISNSDHLVSIVKVIFMYIRSKKHKSESKNVENAKLPEVEKRRTNREQLENLLFMEHSEADHALPATSHDCIHELVSVRNTPLEKATRD